MIKQSTVWVMILIFIAGCIVVLAQGKPHARKTAHRTHAHIKTASEQNIQEYVELLRGNMRQDKAEIMGAMMALDRSDAAKFWPIYGEYDAELTRIDNLKRDNIQEYARNYTQLADEKADELIKKAMGYQKQRAQLLEKYYDRVKESLGAITAARFAQIENQLLMIIDLQITSGLPVVSQPAVPQSAVPVVSQSAQPVVPQTAQAVVSH